MPHAIVIGGGPAGSIAAILLSRAGWQITQVEQHRFPRDKVCGECISATGEDVLTRGGVFKTLLSEGAVRLDRTIFHTNSEGRAEQNLPRPMWGLSRAAMDVLLFRTAAECGVEMRQPARAEAVTPDADGRLVRVRIRDLVANVVKSEAADIVIVADGKASLGCGAPPAQTGDFGIKTHFKNVDGPRDAIELFATARTYGGLAPIEGDRWNAAFSVPAEMLRTSSGDIETLFFHRLVKGNVSLAKRLHRASSCGAWLAAPLPRFTVSNDWPNRVIPVGNAAAALEPIGGEGMGLAMRSAELAAEALTESKGEWTHARASVLRSRFRQLWTVRRFACRAAAVAMSLPFADDLLPLAAAYPPVIRAAMRFIGK